MAGTAGAAINFATLDNKDLLERIRYFMNQYTGCMKCDAFGELVAIAKERNLPWIKYVQSDNMARGDILAEHYHAQALAEYKRNFG